MDGVDEFSHRKSMDRALWITWYDLPDNQRDVYLAWLHGSYLPRLLERPGMLWAAHYAAEDIPLHTAKKKPRRHPPAGAVPGGYRFVLLIGGEHAHVFAHPTPARLHAELPAADREMLALRMGESVNIMIEETRVDGPDANRRAPMTALSPCIQLGSFIHDDDEELLAWYAQWRLPSMTKMPGCVGVRKLVSVSGWAKHAILQEFVSVAARNDNFVNHEQKVHPEQAAWSEKVTGMVTHAPGSPNVAHRIWSAMRN
jgi:hypothetical protein